MSKIPDSITTGRQQTKKQTPPWCLLFFAFRFGGAAVRPGYATGNRGLPKDRRRVY
jgi:hypothetical protein